MSYITYDLNFVPTFFISRWFESFFSEAYEVLPFRPYLKRDIEPDALSWSIASIFPQEASAIQCLAVNSIDNHIAVHVPYSSLDTEIKVIRVVEMNHYFVVILLREGGLPRSGQPAYQQ